MLEDGNWQIKKLTSIHKGHVSNRRGKQSGPSIPPHQLTTFCVIGRVCIKLSTTPFWLRPHLVLVFIAIKAAPVSLGGWVWKVKAWCEGAGQNLSQNGRHCSLSTLSVRKLCFLLRHVSNRRGKQSGPSIPPHQLTTFCVIGRVCIKLSTTPFWLRPHLALVFIAIKAAPVSLVCNAALHFSQVTFVVSPSSKV